MRVNYLDANGKILPNKDALLERHHRLGKYPRARNSCCVSEDGKLSITAGYRGGEYHRRNLQDQEALQ